MRSISWAFALTSVAALAACTTTDSGVGSVQSNLKTKPSYREQLISSCIGPIHSSEKKDEAEKAKDQEGREIVAKMANLPLDANLDRRVCTRLVDAVADGRLSFEEYQGVRFKQMSPNLIRALQGR